MARPSFAKACSTFPHRYTMEHKPEWANKIMPNGMKYAPQYKTDKEWYDNTVFPGEGSELTDKNHCYSSNQSWPLGKLIKN